MPMVYYHNSAATQLGVWHAMESESYFRDALTEAEFPIAEAEAIAHPQKRLQWLAARFVLATLYPEPITTYLGRKPVLRNGPAVSLSHSGDMVGAMVSADFAGMDLQGPDAKLLSIAPKFALPDEEHILPFPERVQRLAALWAVKEAIFKHYGTALPFRQIELKSWDNLSMTAEAHVKRLGEAYMHRVRIDHVNATFIAFIDGLELLNRTPA